MSTLAAELRPIVERFISAIQPLFHAAALDAVTRVLRNQLPRAEERRAPRIAKPRPTPAARGPRVLPLARREVITVPAAPGTRNVAVGPPQVVRVAPRDKRVRRSPEEIDTLAKRIVAFVGANPRSSGDAIRAALRLDRDEWLAPISKLLGAGSLVTSGPRHQTTYAAPTPIIVSTGAVPPIKRQARIPSGAGTASTANAPA